MREPPIGDRETQLTPYQCLRAAVGHWCNGISQQCIGELYGVNFGRVNEAVKVLMMVARNPKRAREVLDASGEFKQDALELDQ